MDSERSFSAYEISNISARFGKYLLDNYSVVSDYLELIKKEKENLKQICEQHQIPLILNHMNTVHLKPNNLDSLKIFLDNKEVYYRTRKLPYDDEPWFALVVYPEFTTSELMNKIIEEHNKEL